MIKLIFRIKFALRIQWVVLMLLYAFSVDIAPSTLRPLFANWPLYLSIDHKQVFTPAMLLNEK